MIAQKFILFGWSAELPFVLFGLWFVRLEFGRLELVALESEQPVLFLESSESVEQPVS